jgi:predicted ArsR family transcriptional regulator
MELPQAAEGPLAQKTRAQIFTFLVERRSACGTEEIAEHLGLHRNGVRRHLERLEEGGLVARGRVKGGQGRPRDVWTVSADANPGGERPRADAHLARWLVRATSADPARERELELVGREIGRELAPTPGESLIEAFLETVAALGFQPELDVKSEGSFSCSLRNCPYQDSAKEKAEVVCTLHRGITAGILAELDPGAELTRFEPGDPERAGCLVEVTDGSSSA